MGILYMYTGRRNCRKTWQAENEKLVWIGGMVGRINKIIEIIRIVSNLRFRSGSCQKTPKMNGSGYLEKTWVLRNELIYS